MPDTAAPPPELTQSFRSAMRKLAATVTIVTTRDEAGHHGMAATAVTSLSTSPPSLLVCVNKTASVHDPLRSSARFCVNLLGTQHEALCNAFGGGLQGEARFGLGDWRTEGEGVRYLADASAILFCTLDEQLSYGTHTIFIGRVDEVRTNPTVNSLLYQEGGVGRFTGL